jgi:hypothetical protein
MFLDEFRGRRYYYWYKPDVGRTFDGTEFGEVRGIDFSTPPPGSLVGSNPARDRLNEFSSDLTGPFCTSRREREFTRRTAGHAKQEVQSRTDRDVAASD